MRAAILAKEIAAAAGLWGIGVSWLAGIVLGIIFKRGIIYKMWYLTAVCEGIMCALARRYRVRYHIQKRYHIQNEVPRAS